MNYFAELVGQEEVKRKLSFYLEAHAKTELVPFLNFVGAVIHVGRNKGLFSL